MENYAIVFPGQGSQKTGMLKDFYAEYRIVKDTFDEASNVLKFDLWDIVQNNSELLLKTEYTQPALLASSVAIFRVLENNNIFSPKVMAGHSLGEYSALVCAEAISLSDGLKVVRSRGQYMQDAVPVGVGAMSAIIGLSDEDVLGVCQEASANTQVSPANFNSPGQVVIAGEKSAVERANVIAKESGARKVQLLPVSVPSHCSLMKPAAEKLNSLLDGIKIKTPKIDVIHNNDVRIHNSVSTIRTVLVKQLYQPVRWTETIQKISTNMGINRVIECGPGKVLSGLNKRIDNSLTLQNTSQLSFFDEIITYKSEKV